MPFPFTRFTSSLFIQRAKRKRFSLSTLLVIAKEHLDGKPRVAADLEPLRDGVDLLDLVVGEVPTVDLEVGLDAAVGDGLGDDAPALLEAPEEEDLLRGAPLGLGDGEEGLVGVEGRVGAAQAGVAGGVDALGGVVGDELGGGVAGVELDLVDGGDDLARSVR